MNATESMSARTPGHRLTRYVLRDGVPHGLAPRGRVVPPRDWNRREAANEAPRPGVWGDRLIAILAVTASLVVAGSFLEELVWAVLAAATVFTLGSKKQ